jgi:hypothetical protein
VCDAFHCFARRQGAGSHVAELADVGLATVARALRCPFCCGSRMKEGPCLLCTHALEADSQSTRPCAYKFPLCRLCSPARPDRADDALSPGSRCLHDQKKLRMAGSDAPECAPPYSRGPRASSGQASPPTHALTPRAPRRRTPPRMTPKRESRRRNGGHAKRVDLMVRFPARAYGRPGRRPASRMRPFACGPAAVLLADVKQ